MELETLEIPDTSSDSDSSNDTIIIPEKDDSKSGVGISLFSNSADSELDKIFEKYLNNDNVRPSIAIPRITSPQSKLEVPDHTLPSTSQFEAQFRETPFKDSLSESITKFDVPDDTLTSSSQFKVHLREKPYKGTLSRSEVKIFDDTSPSTSKHETNRIETHHKEILSQNILEIFDDSLPGTSKPEFTSGEDQNPPRLINYKEFYETNLDELPMIELPTFSQSKRIKRTNKENMGIEMSSKKVEDSSREKDIIDEYIDETNQKALKDQKKGKEQMRQQKLLEKEQKKEEERRNKAMKNALSAYYKNMKPDHCIKFIKVHIDEEIKKKDYSENILNNLKCNGVSFKIEPQLIQNSISWTRQIDSHILDSNGELINTSKGVTIDEILIIMDCNEFINHIYNKTFLTCIESLQSVLNKKKLILVIYELQRYFKYQKNKKNQHMTEELSSKVYKNLKDHKLFNNVPVVSRRTIEYALTEIQLLHSISHRMVETKDELGLMAYQLTKSIAQIPYKLEKQEQFKQSKWFMSEDKKNCIKVDKNGNGLLRLWKQIITTFPLASLETAEAICAVYPTPSSLIKAYEAVSSNLGEKLLQDIPVRRNAGPVSTTRKVGPELSKKMYHLLISKDPDKIL